MTHNQNAGRRGHHQQPPFEIVLDDSYSIVCDDVPANCTIRVVPVDGRSPPRLSPVSQTRWIEGNRPRPEPGSSRGDYNWIPFQKRDKYCNFAGYPIAPPPSHWRSRRSIVDSVMRNIEENNEGATSKGIHNGEAGGEHDVFPLRKNCNHKFSDSPSPTPSFESSDSYSSSSRQPSPPQSAQSTITDRLLNSNRQQPNFRRTNINVDGTDLREMHSDLGPRAAQTSSPELQSSKAKKEKRPQWASHFPPSSPSSRPAAPSAVTGGRCCAMAEYDPSNYRSKTPERDSGGASCSDAGSVTVCGPCTYHGSQPCPVRSGSYCKANRAGRDGGSPSPPPNLRGARSCKYHDSLPCPVLAGVPCRGEIQKNGSSRSSSPDPESRSPPRSPSPDQRLKHLPESNSVWPRSGCRSTGAAAPRRISPPPKSPRSRSPPSRRAPQKSKGTCL